MWSRVWLMEDKWRWVTHVVDAGLLRAWRFRRLAQAQDPSNPMVGGEWNMQRIADMCGWSVWAETYTVSSRWCDFWIEGRSL